MSKKATNQSKAPVQQSLTAKTTQSVVKTPVKA